jgi:hypothetical protein
MEAILAALNESDEKTKNELKNSIMSVAILHCYENINLDQMKDVIFFLI